MDAKIIFQLIGLVMGVVCIFFHRPIGIHVAQFQKQYFGREYSAKVLQIVYLLMGIIFVCLSLFDLLTEFGAIKF